jgi:hypothetical protein
MEERGGCRDGSKWQRLDARKSCTTQIEGRQSEAKQTYDAIAANWGSVRIVSVQAERSEYPVSLVRKSAVAFEADCETISRIDGQNKSYACN